MEKIFLIILIFVTISISSEETPIINFNEDTQFDKDNYEFNFEYTGEDTGLLIYVNQENKESIILLKCEHLNGTHYHEGLIVDYGGVLILDVKEGLCLLTISQEEEDIVLKGKIWIYPMNKEIDIDLSKKYGQMYTIESFDDKYPTIIYNVENLNRDVAVNFEYSPEYSFDGYTYITDLSNPFKVCKEEECSENVKTYDFKKGNNYKIYIKGEKKQIEVEGDNNPSFYYIAGHSFYPKED